MSTETKNAATSQGKRRGALGPALVILAALILGFILFSRIYTDLLWYRSLDSQQVFVTRVGAMIGLFLASVVIMGAGVAINMAIAYRLRPKLKSMPKASGSIGRYHDAMTSRIRTFILLPSLAIGVLAGTSAVAQVDTFLAWTRATDFGQTDPYFGLDFGFYVFSLPWWQFVATSAMAVLVVATLGAGVVHFITGSLRTAPFRVNVTQAEGQAPQPQIELSNPFTARAQAHLSVLLGLIMIVYGIQNLLGRYALASTTNELFTGISYTDDHSRMTAKLVIAVIAFLAAVVFFANAYLRRWMLPAAAVVLMVVSSLVISMIYPALVQRFTVIPDQPSLERPYIENQIAATRYAYDIADVDIREYSAVTATEPGQLRADAEALPGIRLMDPAVIAPAFEQLQQVRGYYSFSPVLDVDRYVINGTPTDAIVAVREIDLTGVPDQSWPNIHTVYTHGYAMVGAYGNRRQPSGEPSWIVGDIPPVGDLAEHQPRIYFGERSTAYAVVGAPEGTPPVELDTPGGGEGGNETKTTYDGEGGVPIGDLWTRILYAARFSDINLLLSDRVNEESQILYDRTPKERVQKVAPWLTLDGDAYPAIVDGRVVWILDGYTISNSFPNSQRVDMRTVTSDSSAARRGLGDSLPLNYIRNSVKAVVDAHEGTVDLYAWDTEDPIMQTWSRVYPDMVKSKDDVSPDLLAHMRYPQDLFKAQRSVLGRYHTENTDTWFQQSDLWRVPDEPRDERLLEPPYYLSIKWPGDDAPVFSQTAAYVPSGRENLVAYLAVVADASHEKYGEMRVLKLSNTQQIAGPGQTFNAIRTDGEVAERLRPYIQGSADIIYGNLLTLPLGGGLMYVQPIYTQRNEAAQSGTGSYPVLRFVAVRFGERIGIGDSLQAALDMVFEGDAGADTGEHGDGEDPTTPDGDTPATGPEAAQELLREAAAAYEEADRLLREGDLAGYQRQIEMARRKMEEAARALEGQ